MTRAVVSSFSTKLFYGSGATAFGIKDTGFNYFLLIYYNQVLGLDPFLAGLALATAVAIDALSDIAAGYISDNWRSRWGRRHPFMYAAMVPVSIAFVLLWNPPAEALATETRLFAYLLFMAILVRSCITFFEVPNASQGPELSTDYDDRTHLMGFRYLFGWIGGLTMAVLAYMVLFNLDPDSQMGPVGYELFGLIGGAGMFVMMLVSSTGTHRHIPHFHVPGKQAHSGARHVLAEIRGLFHNPSFVAVFVSALFFGAAAGLAQALSIYVASFFWLLESTQIGLIPLLGVIAVPVAFTLAPRLAARWGKKQATMRVFLFAIAFLPVAYLAQIAGFFPDRASGLYLPLLMANFAIETAAIITVQIVFASMNADVVEDRSAQKGGQRDEGLIFASRNFAKKAVSGTGVMLAGGLLWLVEFPEGVPPGEVEPSVVTGLVLVYLPVLMILYLASWFFLRFYRIDKETHESNLRSASLPNT